MDWIDLNALRVGRDFRRRTSTKTLLPTIPLYRPRFGESFIVRPGFEWTVRTWGVETEEDGEFYLVVLPDLWSQLRPVLQNVDLFTVMNQRGVVALWPVNLSSTGPSSQLLPNAMAVAKTGTGSWISFFTEPGGSRDGIVFDEPDEPAPVWPDDTFEELLNAAFIDRVIGDLEHPALRRVLEKSH
jgi:hypothetical protein